MGSTSGLRSQPAVPVQGWRCQSAAPGSPEAAPPTDQELILGVDGWALFMEHIFSCTLSKPLVSPSDESQFLGPHLLQPCVAPSGGRKQRSEAWLCPRPLAGFSREEVFNFIPGTLRDR